LRVRQFFVEDFITEKEAHRMSNDDARADELPNSDVNSSRMSVKNSFLKQNVFLGQRERLDTN